MQIRPCRNAALRSDEDLTARPGRGYLAIPFYPCKRSRGGWGAGGLQGAGAYGDRRSRLTRRCYTPSNRSTAAMKQTLPLFFEVLPLHDGFQHASRTIFSNDFSCSLWV